MNGIGSCCLRFCLLVVIVGISSGIRYQPTWESLDSRPLPAWYDHGKLGIFIHWGVFSVPSAGFNPGSSSGNSEWFWTYWKQFKLPAYVNFMKNNYRPDFTYADFAKEFTAEFFDPNAWAELFQSSGADYIVFTSKHGEGFTNWPSNVSFNWNSMDVGPQRDLVGELMTAIRTKTNLHFGLYHCLYEWLNPLYNNDKANNWKTFDFALKKAMPALYEIVNTYKPDIVWSDGDWEAPDTYWGSKEFLTWLFNDSPVKDNVVTNDRWGMNDTCKHGGYWTCKDRYMPTKVPARKWENTMTIDKGSWGFRRNANLEDYLTIEELLAIFIQTVSLGGNMLMNVGPQKDGVIAPIFEERLRQVGAWMGVNGEAIRGTTPWTTQNDTMVPDTWYTKKDSTIYAFVLTWPSSAVLSLSAPIPTANTTVRLIGYPSPFEWKMRSGGGIDIYFLNIPIDKLPVKYAWVLTLSNLENA